MNRHNRTCLRVETLEDRRLLNAAGFGDPVDTAWSGYLGGGQSDQARAVAVDGQGNAWVTGLTYSAGWVTGGSDTSFGGDCDAFVAKISESGQLLWSTYLGGSAEDEGLGIAVDAAGNAWVTGWTNSSGWAFGGFNTQPGGGSDAFLAKIDNNGTIRWVTYLGGSVNDRGHDVAVDTAGNAWVTGWTRSPDWVGGGFDVTFDGGPYDAFVAGVDTNGQPLWSSYLGGGDKDIGFSIDVDVAGDLWLTGRTASTGWVAGGFDTIFGGGDHDAMVAKITTGGELLWSSYLGGDARDSATAIALDSAGNAWVTGWTDSDGWIAGGENSIPGGGLDAFVGLIGGNGQLRWTTYVGGEEADQGLCIAVDAADKIKIVEITATPK
ncbi:MAG: SBBP repeat-containing protein, partial [Candidatus Nealsonbacteria bacterium]|nr:SBBP repeat-containing protein [Candidatus Nealsonbacteria bacterium]